MIISIPYRCDRSPGVLALISTLPPSRDLFPIFVELLVKTASPGVKGDTVGSATKLVILESGYRLRVPLFIKEGNIIRLDTRSGEYVSKS